MGPVRSSLVHICHTGRRKHDAQCHFEFPSPSLHDVVSCVVNKHHSIKTTPFRLIGTSGAISEGYVDFRRLRDLGDHANS